VRVLALDPGERVGWANFDCDPVSGKVTNLKHGISPLKDMALRVAEKAGSYDVIVMEDYRISAAKVNLHIGSGVPTIQFVGMVRMACWQHPKTKLVVQSNRVKTTAAKTMRKLKPSWYEIIDETVAHDDGHDQDAIMHGWYYVWSNYIKTMDVQ
jgi:hypothetical protein